MRTMTDAKTSTISLRSMPKIVSEKAYNGANRRIERLGLAPLIDEVRRLVSDFQLLLEERKNANGAAALRRILDERFQATRLASHQVGWH
jgi:hypothetical protein